MIILDTDVLAELVKPEVDPSILAWLGAQRRSELATTVVSEAELLAAVAGQPKGRRRDALSQAVARLLGEGLGGRVFPFDRAAAVAFAEMSAGDAAEVAGHAALQVAAIARSRGIPRIATRAWQGPAPRHVKLVSPSSD